MATFDVFVEGPADPGPEARTRLIRLMAQRYGLTEADLAARMERGRFRVKANVDESTAKRYVQELGAIGAHVVVVPSGTARSSAPSLQTPPAGVPIQSAPPAIARTTTPPPRAQTQPSGLAVLGDRASSPSVPPRATPPAGLAVLGDRASQPSTPPRTQTPPAGLAVLGDRASQPSTPPRTQTPPAGLAVLGPTVPTRAATEPPVRSTPTPTAPPSALPPRAASEPAAAPPSALPPRAASEPAAASGQFSSGLAAAFSGEMPAAGGLGALDGEALSLASLDGAEESAPGSAFDLPSNALPASIGPAALPASIGPAALPTPAMPAKPASSGPVDLFAPPDAAAEFKVDLAADELADRERRRSQPLPVASDPGTPPSSPLLKKRAQTPLPMPVAGVVAKEEPRWRFAAGVLLAVVLGFVPAHVVASVREGSAYDEIDAHVIEVQAMVGQPETPIPYAKLDAFRDDAMDRKKSARRNIALLSLAIWAACSAGLGYVWFRRIPWDKLGK